MIKHGEASSQQSIHLQSAVLKNTSVSEPTPKCGIKKTKQSVGLLNIPTHQSPKAPTFLQQSRDFYRRFVITL